MATRGRPPGSPKTGGRVKGKSLDKGERQLVTSRMAGDIMAVYEAMGGVDWLLTFAQANPKEFIQQGLSRLFPAAQRDDADFVQQNNQFNFNQFDTLEAARRVAFALNAGIHAQCEQAREPALIEVTGRAPAPEPAWVPLAESAPEPLDDFQRDMGRGYDRDREREQWAQDIHLTPEQRAAKALVRETVEADISTYVGSAAEQPGGSVPRPPPRELSAGERRRAVMSRRGRDLL